MSETVTVRKPIGRLARRYTGLRLPLQVLRSTAGYYIGTVGEDDIPCSRESEEYFTLPDEATQALEDGNWTQRTTP
ncbi:MAG: hypothetical protein ABW104_18060 [Candidatus Thiodiazotropha sp. 6PLUC2]|nr:hypothetical protein [Candidatus Thiodiazotropha lotti]MCW4218800.1 hypothetical protein [Candidatus Thiodiazotropha lotti]